MGLSARKTPNDVEKDTLLPTCTPFDTSDDDNDDDRSKTRPRRRSRPAFKLAINHSVALGVLALTALCLTGRLSLESFDFPFPTKPTPLPGHVMDGMEQCRLIARPPPSHAPYDGARKWSDRHVEGTGAVLLKNGTVWTGNDDGQEIIYGGNVLMDGGVIRKVYKADEKVDLGELKHVQEVELNRAWVTPGIVDLHSHLGVDSVPMLEGANDGNSFAGPILPWLRSLDGFNTHDQALNLSVAGGITTMLVLPGSAGNIGGQAFPFKPRWTKENTPASMLVAPAFTMGNGTWERTDNWRHIKHACGETPSRVYGQTRMDSAYLLRKAYDNGLRLKQAQDRCCESPKTQTEPFPTSLEWEVLADAIRGNVKVNIHCYETVDLNDLVRISNEYKFHVAAFHHAHETYLVPDLLRQVYGGPPSIAMFAVYARFNRESYRGSEFAPKILADEGFNVVMKSDHPVLDSRYLMFEAAQAHHYGLNFSHALGSVTTHSANAMGLGHRIGHVREGYDADIVVWDSFPLTLGATPKQTYIDGIPQVVSPNAVDKPAEAQKISPAGEYDDEAAEAVATRGDPDLRPKKSSRNVIFQDVAAFYVPGHVPIADLVSLSSNATVVVQDGAIACVGECAVEQGLEFEVIDLKGGSIAPGLITVGAPLGLVEIITEQSTGDGIAYDASKNMPELIDGLVVLAVDAASFGGKDELLAYRSGVTTGVTFPISGSLFTGLSYAFSTSAEHPLSPGAILNPAAALHLVLDNARVSISTELGIIRRLLQGGIHEDTELVHEMQAVKQGKRRLVVHVDKADYIASLIRLKRDVAPGMKMTIFGGMESWMVADELAKEDVGVVINPARSFPTKWNSKRIMPGPPLSQDTLPSYLASRGVKIGLGVTETDMARNTRYEAAWVYTSAPHVFDKQAALDLVSTNLEDLLGLSDREQTVHPTPSWVAYEGDLFSLESRVRGVKAAGVDRVDLF